MFSREWRCLFKLSKEYYHQMLHTHTKTTKQHKKTRNIVYLEKQEIFVFSLIFILTTSLEHNEWIILKNISIWKNDDFKNLFIDVWFMVI